MARQLDWHCDVHDSPHDCPDALILYVRKFREFGLLIHDGGSAYSIISYCPWCGTKLPPSLRDEWFDQLESMGLSPDSPDLPAEFETDEWWRDPKSHHSPDSGRFG